MSSAPTQAAQLDRAFRQRLAEHGLKGAMRAAASRSRTLTPFQLASLLAERALLDSARPARACDIAHRLLLSNSWTNPTSSNVSRALASAHKKLKAHPELHAMLIRDELQSVRDRIALNHGA